MQNSIEQTIQRTRQYWYIDGFGEILVGIVFMLLAGINAMTGPGVPAKTANNLIGFGYPIVILVANFGGRWLVKTLKEKITYPRTGFVEYITPAPGTRKNKAMIAFVLAFVVSIVTFMFIRRLDSRFVILGTGLIFAVFIVYFAVQIPLNRFYFLAVWMVIISILAAWIPLPEAIQTAILLAGASLGWIAGGIYTLVKYLINTQPADTGIGDA